MKTITLNSNTFNTTRPLTNFSGIESILVLSEYKILKKNKKNRIKKFIIQDGDIL